MAFRDTILVTVMFAVLSVISARRPYLLNVQRSRFDPKYDAKEIIKNDPEKYKMGMDIITKLLASSPTQTYIKTFVQDLKDIQKLEEKVKFKNRKPNINHELGQYIFINSQAVQAILNYMEVIERDLAPETALLNTLDKSLAKYNKTYSEHNKRTIAAADSALDKLKCVAILIRDLEKADGVIDRLAILLSFIKKNADADAQINAQLQAVDTVNYFKTMSQSIIQNVSKMGTKQYVVINNQDVDEGISELVKLARALDVIDVFVIPKIPNKILK